VNGKYSDEHISYRYTSAVG